jgi:hypothetical protein
MHDLFQKFMEWPCKVCALKNCVHCPNPNQHHDMCKQVRRRSVAFVQKYRKIGYRFSDNVVCFNCFCPRDVCTDKPVKGVNCKTKFVMLDIIYLISRLDNSSVPTGLDDPNYMLQTIRNYAHYNATIQSVKIFMDTVTA